jgi:hypothetical protein
MVIHPAAPRFSTIGRTTIATEARTSTVLRAGTKIGKETGRAILSKSLYKTSTVVMDPTT